MSFHFKSLRALVALLSACAVTLLFAAAALAQGTTGTITGVVKDPNGAVIPGVRVVARNAATNSETAVTTDGTGFYKIVNLVSGP